MSSTLTPARPTEPSNAPSISNPAERERLAAAYYERKHDALADAFDPSDLKAIAARLGRALTADQTEWLARWAHDGGYAILVEPGARREIVPTEADPATIPAAQAAHREALHSRGAIFNGKPMSTAEAFRAAGFIPERRRTRTGKVVTVFKAPRVKTRPAQGRAPRVATNARTKGSRRGGTRARSPDDDPSESEPRRCKGCGAEIGHRAPQARFCEDDACRKRWERAELDTPGTRFAAMAQEKRLAAWRAVGGELLLAAVAGFLELDDADDLLPRPRSVC